MCWCFFNLLITHTHTHTRLIRLEFIWHVLDVIMQTTFARLDCVAHHIWSQKGGGGSLSLYMAANIRNNHDLHVCMRVPCYLLRLTRTSKSMINDDVMFFST